MHSKTVGLLLVVFASVMLVFPSATPTFASGTVDLTLAASSCTLSGTQGYCSYACPSQCSNVINLNDMGYACLKWTSDSQLSVSVTSHQTGAPQVGTPQNNPNPTCPVGSRDWTFDFKVTYYSPTCTIRSYNVAFTAYKTADGSSVTKYFTVNVSHCPFAP